MTTTLAKIMTVFLTIASVGTMAGIIANVLGGPNWNAKASQMPEVVFEQANPTAPWTAKRRTNAEDLGGGQILPQAIVTVQKKLIQVEDDAQAKLDQDIALYKNRLTEAKALIEADRDALSRRHAQLSKQYDDLQARLDALGQDFVMEATKQKSELNETRLRRDEYLQYKSQLEELKTQRQAASNELARLRDLLYQAHANLERAKNRQSTLKSDGVVIDENETTDSTAVENPSTTAVPSEAKSTNSEKPQPKPQPDENNPESNDPKPDQSDSEKQ